MWKKGIFQKATDLSDYCTELAVIYNINWNEGIIYAQCVHGLTKKGEQMNKTWSQFN